MANEVSEEGLINGQGYGIYTYMEQTHLRSDFTYRKWFDQIRVYLPNKQFSQTPMKSGPDYLLDRLVTWLQTAVSIVALVFLVLVNLNVITGAQAAEAQPIITTTLGAISTIIVGITSLIGIFAKQGE